MTERDIPKVILDTDTSTGVLGAEIDDGFAILVCLALDREGKIDLLGITEVAGNTNVDQGVACALKILEMTKREDVPVYRGADKPLIMVERKPPFNPDKVQEPYGGYAKIKAKNEHAIDFIIDEIMKFPGEVTLIPVGPLMNIAMAIRKEPRIVNKVKEIVSMGGEFRSGLLPGGFNWWFSPYATRIVLRSGIPLTVVPLDVTIKTAITMDQLNSIKQNKVVQWLKVTSEPFMKKKANDNKAAPLHDPLAVAVLVDKTIALKHEELYVDTIVSGPWAGMTVGQYTTFGWAPPFGNIKKEEIKKAKVVWQHDDPKYVDLYLKALQTF